MRNKTTSGFFTGESLPLCLLGLAIFLFFIEVFFLKVGFFSGDHRAQHYPWAAFYAAHIKNFQLPWWTTLFHCGFPLLAEGQVGALYPLNIVFYFFLPFPLAYTYNILAHFFISAFFIYILLRSLGLSRSAALFGGLIYLFGTAQGGYYYNIISLKVLTWFPFALYLVRKIIEDDRYDLFSWLALVFAFQIFAGYLQYAVYSIAFTAFFFFWFAFSKSRETHRPDRFWKQFAAFAAALFCAILVALPQLGSTLELSFFSNRYGFPDEFAYLGSLNPAAVMTLFFPQWDGFLGAEIYVGAIGLFFFLVSLFLPKNKPERFFFWMLLVALLCALGKFNPLFVLFVKLTHFTSFRIPTKFMYFAAFASSVLCAYGFQKWQGLGPTAPSFKKPYRAFLVVSGLGILTLLSGSALLKLFENPIKDAARQFMSVNFSHSVVHTLPMEVYFERLNLFYENILNAIALSNPWNLAFLLFMAGSIIAVAYLQSIGWRATRLIKIALFLFLFTNLYVYSWTTIKGNYETERFIKKPSKLIDDLKDQKGTFRVHRLITAVHKTEGFPMPPHTNMLDRLSIVGGYSPLVRADYYDLLEGIGDIDDSNRLKTATQESIANEKALLNFLNVRYLITDEILHDPSFEKIAEEGDYYLYQNADVMPRAFWVANSFQMNTQKDFTGLVHTGKFEPQRYAYLASADSAQTTNNSLPWLPATILEDQDSRAVFLINVPAPGFLVTSDLSYPGWHAYVNGVEKPVLQVNGVFRGLQLDDPGNTTIEFRYQPIWRTIAGFSAAFGLILFLMPLARGQKGSRQRSLPTEKTSDFIRTLKPYLVTRETCPSCQCSTKGLRTYRLEHFNLYRCLCGLRFIDPSLNAEGQMMIYQSSEALKKINPALEHYYEYETLKKGGRTRNDYEKSLGALRKAGAHGQMLEVGCGTGSFLRFAHERGWQVLGIDSSKPNIELLARQNIPAICEDFLNLKSEKKFGVIVLWDVLEHFQDPSTFIKKSFELLESEGLILIAAPLYPNLLSSLAELVYRVSFGKIRGPMEKMYMVEHALYFSEKSLADILMRHGFTKKISWRTETDLRRYAFGPMTRFLLACFFILARLLKQQNRTIFIGQKKVF